MAFTIVHEQRVNVKFLVKLGIKGKEALDMLRTVYGSDTMKTASFYNWFKRFKEGREDVFDEERVGRPVSANTPENIKAVKDAVTANKGATIRQVSRLTGVKYGTAYTIMKDQLKIKFASPIKKNMMPSPKAKKRKLDTEPLTIGLSELNEPKLEPTSLNSRTSSKPQPNFRQQDGTLPRHNETEYRDQYVDPRK